MIYVNAVLAAVFVGFFSWEEQAVVAGGRWVPALVAGVGMVLALYVLLSTLRPLFPPKA